MKPLKEARFELGFETGIIRFIQTEYRCADVGGLGQEHEKTGVPEEATSCVNHRRCLMAWSWKQYGILDML